MNLLSKLKKNNTGYDLRHIFIGAEGTLGVITAAVVKLFPRPRAVETAFIGVPSPAAAVTLLNRAQARVGGTVTSFELIVRDVIEFTLRHAHGTRDPLAGKHRWYVLMEVSSQHGEGLRESIEQLLADASAAGLIEDATIAASLDQAKAFWRLRHALTESQKPEGGSIKADVSVPVADIPQFLQEATAAAQAIVPGCRPVPFGHLGDGNVHFNVSQPVGADAAQFLAHWDEINGAINKLVLKYNGSISAEHGIGKLKRDLLPKVKDPAALELMRGLKRMLDPNGILNPGKVL
jgi:FAD/FMN-containing dehydrogenase